MEGSDRQGNGLHWARRGADTEKKQQGIFFKKVRSVDARKMAEAIRGQTKIVEQTEPQEEPEEPEEPTETTEPQEQTIVKIRVPKRTNRKLVIKKPKSSN